MGKVMKIAPEKNYRFASYTDIISFQNICLNEKGDHLIISFEDCCFISPVAITILMSLKELGIKYNKNISYDFQSINHLEVREFFEKIGLLGLDAKVSEMQCLYNRFSIENINDSLVVEYIQYVMRLIPVILDEDEYGKIVSIIYEIFINALTHSEVRTGIYVCGYYSSQKDTLSFCIYDLGVGIPYKVRKFLNTASMDVTEALNWALLEGNTTVVTRDYARGLGFSQLTSFITENGGNLKVVSLDGLCDIKGQKINCKKIILPLLGTLYSMEIKNKHENEGEKI